MLGISSTIVTLVPRVAKIFENSHPTTPPPTTSIVSGFSFKLKIPILSRIPSLSRINGGTLDACEPVAIIIFFALTSVELPSFPLTIILFFEANFPSPFIISI